MKVFETALERFGLPEDALSGSRVIISGDKHLSIENHRGLLEYSDEMILVSLFKGRLCIRGRGLTIAAMERKSIVIKGKIYGIDLE